MKLDLMFYLILVTIGYIIGLYVSYKRILISHGPNSNKIKNIKYNHNNKCYMFKPIIKKCE
jgi:hypothetical protein